MLATLVAYLRACEAQGLRPRMALGKIALALAADTDLFLTVAKLRAARVLVARVAEACGAASAGAVMHLTATTSERMLARRDPWVNMLRATAACAGAAFGGADAITRAAVHLGTGQARCLRPAHGAQYPPGAAGGERARPRGRIRRRGACVHREADEDLAGKAWELFQDVERQGGMAPRAGERLLAGRDREGRRGARPELSRRVGWS